MRIGEVYRSRNSTVPIRTFIILNLSGPYANVKYLDHGKLRNADIPRRDIDETQRYMKIGYLNLEKAIIEKLTKMEGHK